MSFEGWNIRKIGDFSIVRGGKRLPKGSLLTSNKTNHPYVRLVDIKDSKIDKSNLLYIDNKTYLGISRYVVKSDDVCLAIVGHTIGMVFYVTDEFNGANLTENAVKIEMVGKLNSKFLFYYLLSDEGQHQIKARTVGSAQGKLPLYNVKSIEIPIPTLNEQETISSILTALDEKIKLNNRMNKVLEQIAQVIFMQWFGDFEFPNENGEPYKSSGGVMEWCEELGKGKPSGWKVGSIDQMAVFKNGKGIKNESRDENGKFKIMGSNGLIGFTNEILFNEPVITIGRVGANYGEIHYSNEPCWVSDNAITSQPINNNDFWFLLNVLRRIDYSNFVAGSAQPLITQTSVKSTITILPSRDVLNQFDNIVNNINYRIAINIKESMCLSNIRNILLPKFMSGEIDVSQVEL